MALAVTNHITDGWVPRSGSVDEVRTLALALGLDLADVNVADARYRAGHMVWPRRAIRHNAVMDAGVASLIGACVGGGFAVCGAVVSGWFNRKSAKEQRDLDWAIHQREPRAKAYAELLDQVQGANFELIRERGRLADAAGPLALSEMTSRHQPNELSQILKLSSQVQIEGPAEVAIAADRMVASLIEAHGALWSAWKANNARSALDQELIALNEAISDFDQCRVRFIARASGALASRNS